MAVINGTDLKITISGTAIEGLLSCGISDSMATRDATTKDSGGHEEVLEGLLSTQLTGEGYHDPAFTTGYESLRSTMRSRSTVAFAITSGTTGDTAISGTAYITQLDLNGAKEESCTYSFSLKVTGDTTETPIT